MIDEITHALNHAQGVRDVTEIRLRWSGHRLHAEVNLGVDCALTVTEGHSISVEARHQLLHKLPYLSNVTIHIDPEHLSGENHHSVSEHTHVGLPHHSIVIAARLIKRSSHSIFQRLSRRQRLSTNESLFCILQIDSTTAVGSTNFRRSKECLT